MSLSQLTVRLSLPAVMLAFAPWALAADDESTAAPKPSLSTPASTEADVPTYSLLEAMNDGLVDVQAEGRGDGRMTVAVTNNTKRRLRVVLPPGLVAQGATGQMGMMGGMGGGMGGGMRGGMGGGMGGMGGGMGGRGGMMGGRGMMGGGVMPPMMGLMMLGRLIMSLAGDYDSWDQRSLMMGMMGMRGGMGGMGMGGMGGMGGGMGGMGMGMRSVPPTGLPFAEVKPGQTRSLRTRLVSLERPGADNAVQLPGEGEKLQIGDISQVNKDPKVQKALKRLAAVKANIWVSQMVMWRVASRLSWEEIGQLAQSWGNPYELALAQNLVESLDDLPNDETGVLRFRVEAKDDKDRTRAEELTKAMKDKPILGLWAREDVPTEPLGPAIACRIRLDGDEATVLVNSSDAAVENWVPYGKFTLPIAVKDGKLDVDTFTNGVAEGVLNRMVRAKVAKGPKVKGKTTYAVQIVNASPLILNGLAVVGADVGESDAQPRQLAGFSVSPRRSLVVPASEEVAKELGLKKNVHIVAADLSRL